MDVTVVLDTEESAKRALVRAMPRMLAVTADSAGILREAS